MTDKIDCAQCLHAVIEELKRIKAIKQSLDPDESLEIEDLMVLLMLVELRSLRGEVETIKSELFRISRPSKAGT